MNTILVDMDGVFADFVQNLYDIIELEHKELSLRMPERTKLEKFYIDDCTDDEDVKQVIRAVVDCHKNMFAGIKPFPGAIEGLKALKRLAESFDFQTVICTAPHGINKHCYSQKAEWIEKYLGASWLGRLIMTHDKTLVRGEVLIDDKPVITGSMTPSWAHVVFDRSYNKHIHQPRMVDWSPESIKQVVDLAVKLSTSEVAAV